MLGTGSSWNTFICVCKTRADFVASAACLLAWLSWISISLRSPSIFFLSRMASFLLRASESRVDCSESMARCWFLLKRTWKVNGVIFLSAQERRTICNGTLLSGSVPFPEIEVYFWMTYIAQVSSASLLSNWLVCFTPSADPWSVSTYSILLPHFLWQYWSKEFSQISCKLKQVQVWT